MKGLFVASILFMVSIIISLTYIYPSNKGDAEMTTTEIRSEWHNLDKKVVYFGHQSVGANLMDGVRSVYTDAYFHDFYIGENRDPESKIDDFKHQVMLAKEEGRKIDIALMKFCYVDIDRSTNVSEIVTRYMITMMELQMEYPEIRFIHMTVPLTTEYLPMFSKRNMKRIMKGLLNRPTYDKVANVNREKFNRMLRESVNEYFLFDLAKLESVAKEFLSFLSK